MNVTTSKQWHRFIVEAQKAGSEVMELGTSAASITFGEHTVLVGFTPGLGVHISRGLSYVTISQGLNLLKAMSEWEAKALHPERV